MKWFELVEDSGDGSSATRRFRTLEEAMLYEARNEEWCYSGISEIDTDSADFFDELEDY